MATTYNNFTDNTPDISLNVGNTFGIDADFEVPAFAEANEYVPEIDSTYCFDKNTTLAILAGFRTTVSNDSRSSWIWKINSYRTSCCKAELAMHQNKFRFTYQQTRFAR
ncbi:MAG: hypothetical protein CM15mP22_4080 [Gammaproteobacteria bacterium]|nr:MAG: hypothetical protein CM15mP22_4080 [Gammaproteobacteria bacterium]